MRRIPAVFCSLLLPTVVTAQEPPAGAHAVLERMYAGQPAATSLSQEAPAAEALPGVIPLQPRPPARQLCRTVFGYLPHWERSTATIRYDLLTHIALFSFGVSSTGTVTNPSGWPWTTIINDAHQSGVKVVLVATNFTPSSIETLINNPTYRSAFYANMKSRMQDVHADGLNIDFEGTSGTWRGQIQSFMAELTAYMHAEIPGCEVTFAGPAVNWSSAWNLPALAASCDGIFIMGYAFWGSWSSTSGPNAPLTGGSVNITNTVTVQYANVPREKLILGLPYYGGHWTTKTSAARSSVVDWIGSTRFYEDQPNALIYGRQWDTASQTPWYRWHDGTDWHQVWYDDAQSLGLKYDLADSENLQGVGMWALGYDRTRTELWEELERRYYRNCTARLPDFDGDRDVDQADFGRFQLCITGPDIPQNDTTCARAKLDSDSDVDANDVTLFTGCMTGPGGTLDPTCLP